MLSSRWTFFVKYIHGPLMILIIGSVLGPVAFANDYRDSDGAPMPPVFRWIFLGAFAALCVGILRFAVRLTSRDSARASSSYRQVAHVSDSGARIRRSRSSVDTRKQFTKCQVATPNDVAYIFVPAYMMCAFGVPGNMIQGEVRLGFAEIPVVSGVANGMYVTKSELPPLAFAVTESKVPPKI